MKSNIKLFIISVFCILILSCSGDDDNSNNPESQLPEATQTGANTVGCLVDGKVFLPKAEGISPAVVVYYQFFEGQYYFVLRFTDQRNGNNENIRLRTQRINLESNETYALNKNFNDNGDFIGGGGEYQSNSFNKFFTDGSYTGELTITRLDLSNSIISGTFWFDAVNEEGEIVEIREGRFDYVY